MIVKKIEIAGQRLVVMEEKDYEQLCARAKTAMLDDSDGDLPAYPAAAADGSVPAAEYMRVSLARDIIRDRRAAGLTQADLAKLAGTRPETVSRIESGSYSPSIRMVDRIDEALKKALAQRKKQKKRV